MTEPRCWYCKVRPLYMVDVSTFGDSTPRSIPGRWPPGNVDHQHAVTPPTPAELVDEGHRILRRILEDWWPS